MPAISCTSEPFGFPLHSCSPQLQGGGEPRSRPADDDDVAVTLDGVRCVFTHDADVTSDAENRKDTC